MVEVAMVEAATVEEHMKVTNAMVGLKSVIARMASPFNSLNLFICILLLSVLRCVPPRNSFVTLAPPTQYMFWICLRPFWSEVHSHSRE